MARIIRLHPALTHYRYHIFTDLDFWDARRLLEGLVDVRRNFGGVLSGDEYPTQVLSDTISSEDIRAVESRLARAITSPPRHVIVRSMVFEGHFDFDPKIYYPPLWSAARMLAFTYHRLPLQQSALSNPFQTVKLSWVGEKIRIERVQRQTMHQEVIKTTRDARRKMAVPSCF